MNIGFDGKRAANNLTGLGNYSRSLILQLSEFFPQNQYFVYTPKYKKTGQINHFFEKKNIRLVLPEQFSFLWRSFGIRKQLKKDNIAIYHGLSGEIPVGIPAEIRTVVTIHDLIYLRFPQHYKFIDRTIYNLKSKYACKHADHIIAISEQTKNDIIEYYQVEPSKIEVLYQTCDDSFKQIIPQDFKDTIRLKYNLPEKYILNVGTIEPRKNLLILIQALPSVDPAFKLVVVGKKQAYAEQVIAEITRLGLEERVIFLKDIPFTDLPSIYQLATLFVYPSFYEGFGIPVIEALYGGIPTIAATGSCLEEAGGPHSIYVSPNDPAGFAGAINSVLTDPELARRMKEEGLKYVQKFNTTSLSAQLMDSYNNLINLHHAKNGN
ncbi:glycosyltransferase family 4 protein [Pedobacter cryoconitis]|uniref:Glycosyltransferase involved in cell wall biosynthesis n=1 Tax=Pedobacter cryoconitis TaxID=188932 RepID=A0A7X0J630_9SPHI|nr:glycosyltransferase family 1 protein [Pedobacter cryoconitis]MBB6500517.1 glycosyltransferase involved in cell wall biosynthesis [Pedobacter cryoconitis]